MQTTPDAVGAAATASGAPEQEHARSSRVGRLLREIARGGLASLIAGTVVGGVGGRLIMRIAAILSPEATGRLTDNGEVVGTISANGTLALLIFGGLLTGAVGGVVWVVVSPWLPSRGRLRHAAAALVAVALFGSFLARSDNRDFAILAADALVLGMLLILLAVTDWATAWLDDRLEERLPAAAIDRPRPLVAYAVVAVVGCLFVPLAITSYFGSTSSPYPMNAIGWAIAIVAAVTSVAWLLRLTRPDGGLPASPILIAGRLAVVVAVGAGLVHLVPEVGRILAVD